MTPDNRDEEEKPMDMYDTFSNNYDRFVDWKDRLTYELPFLDSHLFTLNVGGRPIRVLDAACGTGMHTIALAKRGMAAAGADRSACMLVTARVNASHENASVEFTEAGFGELAAAFATSPLFPFDALLCLGNSLPHVLSVTDLAAALADFAACLRPGGMLLIQNRNFDALKINPQRWMEPQSHREGSREWVFQRFYDYDPDGLITFNVTTLTREGEGPWKQEVASTRLRPLLLDELTAAVQAAGFGEIETYGSLAGGSFDPGSSSNLVLKARLP